MAGIIALSMFVLLATAISYYGYRHYARPGRIFEQVGTAPLKAESDEVVRGSPAGPGIIIRTIQSIGEKVPVAPQDASLMRRYLFAAGYRSPTALTTFYGLKVALSVILVAFVFLVRTYITPIPLLQMLMLAGAGLAGYFGPNLVLERLIGRRQEKLRFSLPDALDLMVVSVEGGLALDQAIQIVSRELEITHPEICEDLRLVTLEMRAGTRRADALRNLAERTGEPEIRNLVAVLIQTDRFGTSMADSLRTHSEYLRIRRRQDAEERANKVGVKLVFPIFFCILPSMFLVTGGPALLQILKQLRPLIRQFGH